MVKGEGKVFSFFVSIWSAVLNFLVGYTLGVGLTSSSPKYLLRLGEGAKQRGAKLTFLFMDGFVLGKGKVNLYG